MKDLFQMALALNLITHTTTNTSIVTPTSIAHFGPIDPKIMKQLDYFNIGYSIDDTDGNLFFTAPNGAEILIIANRDDGFYEDAVHKLLSHYLTQK